MIRVVTTLNDYRNRNSLNFCHVVSNLIHLLSIYESTGYEFDNIDKIIRRFANCFFKKFAKNESEKLKAENDNYFCDKFSLHWL